MDDKHLREEIAALEQEIAKLPRGYLSRKTINGKVRIYLQWSEGGKKKSRYVDDELAENLRERIETRKRLQGKLKTLKAQLPVVEQAVPKPETAFRTTVMSGNRLGLFVESVKNYKRRFCFKELTDYLYGDICDKVLILYGLRRTGKTTLIRQAISDMSATAIDRCAFIQIRTGNTLSQVNADLQLLSRLGYRYIFIDEVTLIDDFIEGAALFSDVFAACGMKIVLSGTDSLGFAFSEEEQLYDRCILLHTTFIPYREFEEVLGIKGIDEYIRYGGTMSMGGVNYNTPTTFATAQSTDEYVDSAIARNIQHSLKHYRYEGHFRALQDLYDHGELTSVINRVIEDINHRFTLEVLTQDFVSHDLGISAKNHRSDRERPTDILDRIDKDEVTRRLKEMLEIRNKEEQLVAVSDIHRKEIKEYLDLLDLTVDIEVRSVPASDKVATRTLFSQPGMRYSQAESLVRSLMQDARFMDISAIDRAAVVERILDEIKGRMIEDIVLLETKMAYPQKQVFKLQFAVGEFDMVVVDPRQSTCEIYEIKHSTQRNPVQYKNLIDKTKCREAEFSYGKIIKRCVLYRGESTTVGEIEYRNVEEFLSAY